MPETTDSREGVEINGVAHVILRVSRISECIAFYDRLMLRDPEGIRLELNHVPGKGLLTEGATFLPDPDYPLRGDPADPGR